MHVNGGHLNGYFEGLLCTCISHRFFIGLSLDYVVYA